MVGDGIATREPSPVALEAILAGCARIVSVSDDEMLDAIAAYHADTHNLAENGAGASPLAALMQERDAMAGRKVGLILSGGNVDPGVYARALARLDAGPA